MINSMLHLPSVDTYANSLGTSDLTTLPETKNPALEDLVEELKIDNLGSKRESSK